MSYIYMFRLSLSLLADVLVYSSLLKTMCFGGNCWCLLLAGWLFVCISAQRSLFPSGFARLFVCWAALRLQVGLFANVFHLILFTVWMFLDAGWLISLLIWLLCARYLCACACVCKYVERVGISEGDCVRQTERKGKRDSGRVGGMKTGKEGGNDCVSSVLSRSRYPRLCDSGTMNVYMCVCVSEREKIPGSVCLCV